MKVSSTVAILSTIALAAAQYTFSAQDSYFKCIKPQGHQAYCAGGDIIIRCVDGIGHAGSCTDATAGEKPVGSTTLAGCYQSYSYAGDAACTKAGVVYPATGAGASQLTDPYPVPGAAPFSNSTAPFANTTAPYSNTTSASNNNNNYKDDHRWSNSTVTTTAPCPTFTAGSPTTLNAAPAGATTTNRVVQQFTGDAVVLSRGPYLAIAVLGAISLL